MPRGRRRDPADVAASWRPSTLALMTWLIRRGTHLITRDLVLFGFGLWGLFHETVNGPERQSFLLLFGAMVGAPFVLRADEYIDAKRRRPRGDP